MFEKVNPMHPDKIADRIAGAMVDLAYTQQTNPKVAIEVLIGHDECNVICETSYRFIASEVYEIIERVTGRNDIKVNLKCVPQDVHLSDNQENEIKCGDNGIFKGVPVTFEQNELSNIVRDLYDIYPTDGKYIINGKNIIACQSNANKEDIEKEIAKYGYTPQVNPLGDWTGGVNVDSGATNRKLGSDMADSITGGGLHGKDFSKADVSVNVYAWIKAQETGEEVNINCAIGDTIVDGRPYSEIVEIAKDYIYSLGGFEKFAEWGLV